MMNDQDEMFERATETPAFLGCPQHMPTHLPGGFDGTEPGEKSKSEVEVEELKKRGAKLKACNDRSRARIVDIAHLANECLLNTHHPDGYKPGQYGEDYRAFGKAFAEIRRLVKESIGDVDPDYEMLALQFARDSFDFSKFQEALAAVASMKQDDFPGTYYTPGWLVELAKRISGSETITSREKPLDPTAPEMKAAKQKEYFRKHFSFCDGLFPIRFTNTEDGHMASCWINGRHFTLDIDNNERDDGGNDCAANIRDNGNVVITIETQRGKSISGKVAYGAFKEYVRNLSGSGKYSSRGGFLKQAAKRAMAAKKIGGAK